MGDTLNLASTATTSEISSAREICNAYRTKRLKIISGSSVSSINFNLKNRSCEGSSYENTTEVAVDTRVSFVNKGLWNLYQPNLETDLSGSLAKICSEVYSGSALSILSYASDGTAIQYQLNSDLSFFIYRGVKSETDSTKYTVTEKVKFTLDSDTNSDTFGYVKDYKKDSMCSNGKDFSYIQQYF
ncbi:hypothetical protein M900_A0465 [Bacteriovorax sp. Seq25_V]|nr:hypothetical protein M900_A0465 [Bacteriovorax sp. Seq25_V]